MCNQGPTDFANARATDWIRSTYLLNFLVQLPWLVPLLASLSAVYVVTVWLFPYALCRFWQLFFFFSPRVKQKTIKYMTVSYSWNIYCPSLLVRLTKNKIWIWGNNCFHSSGSRKNKSRNRKQSMIFLLCACTQSGRRVREKVFKTHMLHLSFPILLLHHLVPCTVICHYMNWIHTNISCTTQAICLTSSAARVYFGDSRLL